MIERFNLSDDNSVWEWADSGILDDPEHVERGRRGLKREPMSQDEILEYADGLGPWAAEVFRRAKARRDDYS